MTKRNSKDDAYMKAIRQIAQDNNPRPTTKTRAEIEADIAAISEELNGPMHNVMRLDLVEARRALRNQLASLA